MTLLSAFLATAAPWLVGATSVVLLLRKQLSDRPNQGQLVAYIGLGGAIGLYTNTFIAQAFYLLKIDGSIGIWLGGLFLALTAAQALLIHYKVKIRFAFPSGRGRKFDFLTISYVSILLFFWTYTTNESPAFGWDNLQHWSRVAIDGLKLYGVTPVQPLNGSSTHPYTVGYTGSLPAATGSIYGGRNLYFLIWSLAALSIALIVFGNARRIGVSLQVATVLALIGLTLPLVENHITIVGYAELFVMCFSMGATFTAVSAFEERRPRLFWLTGLSLIYLSLTKNVSYIYALTILAAILLHRALLAHRLSLLVGCITLFFIALIIAIGAISYSDSGFVSIGNRQVSIAEIDVYQIFQNEIRSKFFNQSFSVLVSCFLIAIAYWKKYGYGNGSQIFLFSFSGFWLFLIVSQFTDYGMKHATPGSDTGNSRFFVQVVGLLLLYAAYMIKQSCRKVSS